MGAPAGGIPVQLVDGEHGYLVDADDVETAADRIERLLCDESLRRELGRAGHERVRRAFLLPRQLEECLECLADVV